MHSFAPATFCRWFPLFFYGQNYMSGMLCDVPEKLNVKNCSSSKLLPVVKKCSILKQYCQFIEIVEHNYNKLFPKKSFKKAIEIAMEQGILKDYLDRKSREVINMLCAKYDYKMDIAVKQEEAREEGIAIGMQEGAQQKALELAKSFYSNGASVELIAKSLGMPVEKVEKIIEE